MSNLDILKSLGIDVKFIERRISFNDAMLSLCMPEGMFRAIRPGLIFK